VETSTDKARDASQTDKKKRPRRKEGKDSLALPGWSLPETKKKTGASFYKITSEKKKGPPTIRYMRLSSIKRSGSQMPRNTFKMGPG